MKAIVIGGVAAGMSAASKLRRVKLAASYPTAHAAFLIMWAASTTIPRN